MIYNKAFDFNNRYNNHKVITSADDFYNNKVYLYKIYKQLNKIVNKSDKNFEYRMY